MMKNNWRKILATASVLSLTAGCLAGCGEPQSNNGGIAPPDSQEAGKITFPLAEQVGLTVPTTRSTGM